MKNYLNRKVSAEILRDLYECWLIFFTGIFVHYNHWRLLAYETMSPLDPLVNQPVGDNQRWAGVFFGSGVLLALLQYRPLWVRRCRHRVHLLMLLAEMMLMLQLAEWTDRQLWQPFLGIVGDLFLALGRAEWGNWLQSHLPAIVGTQLLSGDAFDIFRLLASLAIFVAAFDSTAVGWRNSVEFLLIGYLPETSACRQLIWEEQEKKGRERRKSGQLPNPSPELLIYKRLCYICMQRMNSDLQDDGEYNQS
ncbi:uncharacterized protein Andorra [Drosophila takahashii]|uniref:uncharacterized protein Andorra n=1 Tax=Drosophila takahashii TaxID=29030 RepID=UPI001CF821D6|nr:uncharacterized protein LOC108060996 [Drosophila takahashii]